MYRYLNTISFCKMEKSKNSLSARSAGGGGLQTPPHEFQKIEQKVFKTRQNRKNIRLKKKPRGTVIFLEYF